MIQNLFLKYAEKLRELRQSETDTTVLEVLNKVIRDGDLEDYLVNKLWYHAEIRSLVKRSIDLPNQEAAYKHFIKTFPYRTFVRNFNDENYLRVFLTGKAYDYQNKFLNPTEPFNFTEPDTPQSPEFNLGAYQPLADTQTPAQDTAQPEITTTINQSNSSLEIEKHDTDSELNLEIENHQTNTSTVNYTDQINLKNTQPVAQVPINQPIVAPAIKIPNEPINIPAPKRPESITQNKRNLQQRNTFTPVSRSLPKTQISSPQQSSPVKKIIAASVIGTGTVASIPFIQLLLF